MKKIISLLLVMSLTFSSTSVPFLQPSLASAEETTINTEDNNINQPSTPLEKEITTTEENEIQPMILPVWAAWTLAAIAGAVISEIVSDIYSEVKDYVYNSKSQQAANTNLTGSIYDINMYQDKFNATLTANHVGDGKTNNSVRVITLQKGLNARGYNTTVDGIWGPNTKSSVKNFQASKGLTSDGIVGKDTWYYLQNK
ncbi:peptidoglycan-binding domain-containing protein [Psychrobacillus sp. L4]|uniref:peptidoglycan-binding domain-containing protein n=1 Tax=Psychrobacillus sp. L4 TaxID=3236892 RepID=UPI0036F2E6DB